MNQKLMTYIIAWLMISALLLMKFGGLILAVAFAVKGRWGAFIAALAASITSHVALCTLNTADTHQEEEEDRQE